MNSNYEGRIIYLQEKIQQLQDSLYLERHEVQRLKIELHKLQMKNNELEGVARLQSQALEAKQHKGFAFIYGK